MTDHELSPAARLVKLRQQIGAIDDQIIKLIQQRMDVSTTIATIKVAERLPIEDTAVEEQLTNAHAEAAQKYGLDPKFVAKIGRALMDHSKSVQRDFSKRASDGRERG